MKITQYKELLRDKNAFAIALMFHARVKLEMSAFNDCEAVINDVFTLFEDIERRRKLRQSFFQYDTLFSLVQSFTQSSMILFVIVVR